MMTERNSNGKGCKALAGERYDWPTLLRLARDAIHAANVAVMEHAALERVGWTQQQGKDA